MTKEQIQRNLDRIEAEKKATDLKRQKAQDAKLNNSILKKRASTEVKRTNSVRNDFLKDLIAKTNNNWEIKFLTNLLTYNTLTEKQRAVVKNIQNKLKKN